MSVDEVSARHQARHEDGHYRRIGADHGWPPACMDAGGEGADRCGQRRANYDEVLEDPLVTAAPGRCAISRLARHLPRYDEVIAPSRTVCPCCSGQLHCIDVSEALDFGRLLLCEADDPCPLCLSSVQRRNRANAGASPSHSWRHGDHSAGGPCGRFQVRLAVAFQSASTDPGRPQHHAESRNPRISGGAGRLVAQAPL